MKRSVGLVAIATAFLLGNDPVVAQGSNTKKAEERTAVHENSTLNLLNASPAELRRFLQRWSPNRLAKNCENEPHDDSRVGWLYPIPGGAWFLVGRADDMETNIEDMIRMYHVEKYLKTGTPLKGQIYIKLQAETARQERACLGTLQEMPVRWIVSNNESPDAGETIEMVVQEVRFSREVRVDSAGDTIPTGGTVAGLMLSESWWSMAYRKLAEQVWGAALGFAGSVCLMLLIAIVRLVQYRRRLRRPSGEATMED